MSAPTRQRSRVPQSPFAVLGLCLAAAALAVVIVVALTSGGPTSTGPVSSTTSHTSTTVSGASSRPFSPTSVWNAPLPADSPLSPKSATYVQQLLAQVHHYGYYIDTTKYSIPVYTVPAGQRRFPVVLDNVGPYAPARELAAAFKAGVPIPAAAQAAAGSDSTMTIWQPATDTLWDFWRIHRVDGVWHASWGGVMPHVSSNPGYFTDPKIWGATATSLPLLGGLIRISELRAGHIDHALSLAIPQTAAKVFTFPAERTDGYVDSPDAIPEGTEFRLNPKVDVASLGLPPVARMIALAAQRYGVIIADKSGAVTFDAEDPTPTGGNPYAGPHGLFGDMAAWQLLVKFPWQDLEVIQPRYSDR